MTATIRRHGETWSVVPHSLRDGADGPWLNMLCRRDHYLDNAYGEWRLPLGWNGERMARGYASRWCEATRPWLLQEIKGLFALGLLEMQPVADPPDMTVPFPRAPGPLKGRRFDAYLVTSDYRAWPWEARRIRLSFNGKRDKRRKLHPLLRSFYLYHFDYRAGDKWGGSSELRDLLDAELPGLLGSIETAMADENVENRDLTRSQR